MAWSSGTPPAACPVANPRSVVFGVVPPLVRGRATLPAALTWPAKDPRQTLDYTLDASGYLATTGATLVDARVSVDPSLAVETWRLAPAYAAFGSVVVYLGGGVDGASPIVSVTLLLIDAFGQAIQEIAPIVLPIALRTPAGLVPTSRDGAPAITDDSGAVLIDPTTGEPVFTFYDPPVLVDGGGVTLTDSAGVPLHLSYPSRPGAPF